MATNTVSAGPSTDRRRPPAYRPAHAPRTSIRTRAHAGPADTDRIAVTAPSRPCDVCARTRRLEQRVGRTLRRLLVVIALAACASLATPHKAIVSTSAPAAEQPPSSTGPAAATNAFASSTCAPSLLAVPGCLSPTTSSVPDGLGTAG